MNRGARISKNCSGTDSLQPLPGWLGWRHHARHWLARWLFAVRVQDVGSFFTLCRREIFERIPLQSDGPFAQVEILAKANFLGCWMAEAPVSYNPPPGPSASYFAEAYHVFSEPDFGPVDPNAPPAPETPPTPAVSSDVPGP